MLPTNGKNTSYGKRSYHMTITELAELLAHIRERYDTKFYVLVLTQFCMGMRASEALSIQIMEQKEAYLLPVINPIVNILTMQSKGQISLNKYKEVIK